MDGTLANDYLYRNAVPNHPELNAMNTDLGMGNHNINNAGSITASGNVTANGDLTARNVTASANVNAATANVTGETYTGGWFRTRGDTGWYSEKWGGGIYQNSPDWVQVYNNKNFSTGGQLWGGKITSTGKITAYDRIATNEYISVGGLATEGAACSDRTLIAKSATGLTLSCQSGVWRSSGGGGVTDLCNISAGGDVADDATCAAVCTGSAPGQWRSIGGWDMDKGGGAGRTSGKTPSPFYGTGNFISTLCAKFN